MKGAIIGDIVGSIYEFDNIHTKDFPLFGEGCDFTDDTVMTCAVGHALCDICEATVIGDRRTTDLIGASMRHYGRMFPNRGYGGNFQRWIHSANPKPYNSWGNGAPMRCSAAGWLATSVGNAMDLGRLTAMPTHNHPEGVKAAEVTAILIYLAHYGWKMDALLTSASICYHIPKLDDIRDIYVFSEASMDTMPVALAAFFESTSFEDAIRNAISVGGDSDTIAAITGSIAEAYYGVPDEIWDKARSYLPMLLRTDVARVYESMEGR